MNLHVKKGDNVVILAGKDKGKTGKIVSANPTSKRVVVDGLNMITKHVKPRGANKPGGINKVAGPIDASNVQVICSACNKASRPAHKEIDGKNIRVCMKCGASLEPKVRVDKKTKKGKAEDTAAKTDSKSVEAADKKTVKKTVKKTAENKAADETGAAKE